ncbi:MAG: molecular chaperone DnaJ [Okeania sp. SIO1I7]|nr:molecular chaperone DnaJ [Okeania sp. SIO1I7]
MAKRLVKEKDQLTLNSESAKQLLSSQNLDEDYKKCLQKLSPKQYESFSSSLEIIGQISELNLVYLLQKQSSGQSLNQSQTASKPAANKQKTAPNATPAASDQEKKKPAAAASSSKVEAYYKRAEEFMELDNLTEAAIQLKEAIKVEPKNSKCHGLLGVVYLKQKKMSMAKIHIGQALKLNPQETVALEAKKQMTKAAVQGSGKSKGKAGKQDKSGGGLFGLFGKKK